MLPGEAFRGENITDENCWRLETAAVLGVTNYYMKLKESPCIC